MTLLERIQQAIDGATLPFDAAIVNRIESEWHVVERADDLLVRLDSRGTPTQQQWDDVDNLIFGLDLSGAALNTAENLKQRDDAKTLLNIPKDLGKLFRAVAAVIMDELNVLRQQIIGTATVTFDPPNLADGAGATKSDITVTGAAFGDAVDVCAPYSLQGLTCTGYVHAANTIGVRLQNESGSAVNLASGSWTVIVRRHNVMSDRTLSQAKTAIQNKVDSGASD